MWAIVAGIVAIRMFYVRCVFVPGACEFTMPMYCCVRVRSLQQQDKGAQRFFLLAGACILWRMSIRSAASDVTDADG